MCCSIIGGFVPVRKYLMIICLCSLVVFAGCGGGMSTNNPDTKVPLPPGSRDKFVIAGSGANIPVTVKLAQAYQAKTGIALDIPGSIGSDGAINAVKADSLELGLISRPLNASERSAGLKEVPYARIGLVFAGHRDVADSGFSSQEILEILAGTKTTWADGTKIFVFVRQSNDSANLAFYDLIPGFRAALSEAGEQRRWQVYYRDSDMSDALRKTKGSFGIANLTEIALADSAIKPLALDGIVPTPDNIVNGVYKPVLTLAFVYKGGLTSRAAKVVDFVFSDEGRQILVKWGAVPLER